MLVGHDRVHVPLHHHHPLLAGMFPGHIQGKKYAPLVEYRRPWRVQVLRIGVVQRPASEPGQFSLAVPYRNHQPPPEHVPEAAVIPAGNQSGLCQLLRGIAPPFQVSPERLPVIRAQAQLKMGNRLPVQSPAFQVGPCFRPLGRSQPLLEVSLRRLVQVEGALDFTAPLCAGQRHPRLLRQLTQRLPELQVLRLHHEGEHIPAGRAGAEAPPRLPVGKYVKRRGAFLVERTVGLVRLPGTLQRNLAGNHVQDIQAALDVVDNGHGTAIPPPARSGAAPD